MINIRFTAFVFICLTLGSLAEAATGMTLHGRILMPNGEPLEAGTVFFHIQISSPGTENCLLYDEQQSLPMTGSKGIFVLTIGDGTRVAPAVDGGYSIPRIFANRGTLSGLICDTPHTTYSPGIADGRKLQIQFDDGSGWETLPPQTINYVPLAIEANQVSGYTKDQLLRVADGVTATEFTNAHWTAIWDYITGAGAASGDVLKWNGTAWEPGPESGGGGGGDITAVAAGTGLSGGGTTGSVTLNLANTLVTPGSYGSASKASTFTVDQQGRLTAAGETDIALPVSQLTQSGAGSGEVLKWNGTAWAPADDEGITSLSASDITTALSYTPVDKDGDTMTGLLTLSADPSNNLHAATKQYVDSEVSTVGGAFIKKDGTVAFTGDQSMGGKTLFGNSTASGTLTLESTSDTIKGHLLLNPNGGNVGIGTAGPAGILDVQGGTADAAADGRNILLVAENGGAGNASGGGILLQAGTKAFGGTGVDGTVSVLGNLSTLGKNDALNVLGYMAGVVPDDAVWSGATIAGQAHGAGGVNAAYSGLTVGGYFDAFGNNTQTMIGLNAEGVMRMGRNAVSVTGGKFTAGNSSIFGTLAVAKAGDFSVFNTKPITTGYGVYIGTIGAINKFSLYANDATAPSYFAGNVGIGTTALTAPTAKLEVAGQIVSQESVNTSGATADFANGNSIVLESVGDTAITVSNMVAGGVYNIVIEDTTPRTYTFTGCTNVYFSPANGPTYQRSMYTIYRRGTDTCYITWTTGFN